MEVGTEAGLAGVAMAEVKVEVVKAVDLEEVETVVDLAEEERAEATAVVDLVEAAMVVVKVVDLEAVETVLGEMVVVG